MVYTRVPFNNINLDLYDEEIDEDDFVMETDDVIFDDIFDNSSYNGDLSDEIMSVDSNSDFYHIDIESNSLDNNDDEYDIIDLYCFRNDSPEPFAGPLIPREVQVFALRNFKEFDHVFEAGERPLHTLKNNSNEVPEPPHLETVLNMLSENLLNILQHRGIRLVWKWHFLLNAYTIDEESCEPTQLQIFVPSIKYIIMAYDIQAHKRLSENDTTGTNFVMLFYRDNEHWRMTTSDIPLN